MFRKLFSGASRAAAVAAAASAIGATWERPVAADVSARPQSGGVESVGPPAGADALLPTGKLSCKMSALPPRTPVVLVCCGSFNPPTIMHMRMVDLAGDELMRRGYDVWGAYLSPVADAYGKAHLAPASDRVAMCRLAAEDESRSRHASRGPSPSDGPHTTAAMRQDATPELTMVYDWEARQPGYTRTLAVLRRVESQLRSWASGGASALSELAPGPSGGALTSAADAGPRGGVVEGETRASLTPAAVAAARPQSVTALTPPPPPPLLTPSQPQAMELGPAKAMLLCGGDVLASMAVPGVWRDPDVILREHGVVCVAREGTDLERLLSQPGSVLYDYRDRIVVVYDRVGNSVSSSKVRKELAAGRPVRYLVSPSVLSYIFEKGLYGTRRVEERAHPREHT